MLVVVIRIYKVNSNTSVQFLLLEKNSFSNNNQYKKVLSIIIMNNSIKYYTTEDRINETLEKYGVAIIPNILNDKECIQMINEMWDYLEHITQNWDTPINRNKKNTWKYIYELNDASLIFQFWNIGHSQMCWNVRQNPKIVNIYSKIYNVKSDELVASFDGASIQFPPEITNFGWKTFPWFHTDQKYNDINQKRIIQSWVTAYDVNQYDASLVILESSHKLHDDCAKKFNIKSEKNFYLLNEDELNYYLDTCKLVEIICPRGSLVLWDSRTIHYAIEPSKIRLNPNIRCVSYLCYAPKIYLDEENKKIRKDAFEKLESTNHNPINVRLKYNTPFDDQNVNNYIVKINKPILTELGKSLI
jgi:ectoine hydroxylase-related dioxygenase (phytanoyl-CoA dioxygenase family)